MESLPSGLGRVKLQCANTAASPAADMPDTRFAGQAGRVLA
jgi:hypothetical protein